MEQSVNGVKWKPKFGRVLIRREVEQKTKAGIIIPETAAKRNAPAEGVIVGLGETAGWTEAYDEKGEPVVIQTLKVGDNVLFGRHAGAWLDSTISKDGKENDDGSLYICQDTDILCVK